MAATSRREKPLRREIRHQRFGTRIGKHTANLLLQNRGIAQRFPFAPPDAGFRHLGCCSTKRKRDPGGKFQIADGGRSRRGIAFDAEQKLRAHQHPIQSLLNASLKPRVRASSGEERHEIVQIGIGHGPPVGPAFQSRQDWDTGSESLSHQRASRGLKLVGHRDQDIASFRGRDLSRSHVFCNSREQKWRIDASQSSVIGQKQTREKIAVVRSALYVAIGGDAEIVGHDSAAHEERPLPPSFFDSDFIGGLSKPCLRPFRGSVGGPFVLFL